MRETIRKTEEIGVDAFERKLDRDHLQSTLEKLLQPRQALSHGVEAAGSSKDTTADRVASAKPIDVEVSDDLTKKPAKKKKTSKKKSG